MTGPGHDAGSERIAIGISIVGQDAFRQDVECGIFGDAVNDQRVRPVPTRVSSELRIARTAACAAIESAPLADANKRSRELTLRQLSLFICHLKSTCPAELHTTTVRCDIVRGVSSRVRLAGHVKKIA